MEISGYIFKRFMKYFGKIFSKNLAGSVPERLKNPRRKIMKNKNNKGFTLVELIVVISILAVLSAGAVLAFSNLANQAQDAADNADAAAVVRSLNLYNSLATTVPAITNSTEIANASAIRTLKITPINSMTVDLGVNISDATWARINPSNGTNEQIIQYDGSVGWFYGAKA